MALEFFDFIKPRINPNIFQNLNANNDEVTITISKNNIQDLECLEKIKDRIR